MTEDEGGRGRTRENEYARTCGGGEDEGLRDWKREEEGARKNKREDEGGRMSTIEDEGGRTCGGGDDEDLTVVSDEVRVTHAHVAGCGVGGGETHAVILARIGLARVTGLLCHNVT
jgi:hypothetical protein